MRKLFLMVVMFSSLVCTFIRAVEPSWWSPIKAPGQIQNDYIAATAGQLKNMAVRAMDEMESKYASVGGAGSDIREMVAAWRNSKAKSASNDYAVVTEKQLKYVAKKFYDRQVELQLRPSAAYPWTDGDPDTMAANVGQLKNVFSFALPTASFGNDADGDGLSNALELSLGFDPLKRDSDGNGILDGDEYLAHPAGGGGVPVQSALGISITCPAEGAKY